MQRLTGSSAFAAGAVCGILLVMLLAGLVGYSTLENGLTVEVGIGALARAVRAEVEAHAQQELPRITEELRKTMPERVAKRLTDSLKSATIKLYDTEIHLPDSAIAELKTNLRQLVVAEIDKSIEQLDTDRLVQEWGEQAEESVEASLQEQLDGQTFLLQPYKWLTVPVTVTTTQ